MHHQCIINGILRIAFAVMLDDEVDRLNDGEADEDRHAIDPTDYIHACLVHIGGPVATKGCVGQVVTPMGQERAAWKAQKGN